MQKIFTDDEDDENEVFEGFTGQYYMSEFHVKYFIILGSWKNKRAQCRIFNLKSQPFDFCPKEIIIWTCACINDASMKGGSTVDLGKCFVALGK